MNQFAALNGFQWPDHPTPKPVTSDEQESTEAGCNHLVFVYRKTAAVPAAPPRDHAAFPRRAA
jgi:hypothetical protein